MIEAAGLTKRYGRTVAVDDLSFRVQPGRVTGFLGPNGAGKSTTMRLALGLDHPDAGPVLIEGKRYRQLNRPLRTVGAPLDARWVHPHRSARSHLRWLAKSNRISAGRVDEVIELGVVLPELNPMSGSLEEAFMQLTGEVVGYHAHAATEVTG